MSRAAAQPPRRMNRNVIIYATIAVIAIGAIVAVALANRVPMAAQTVNPNTALAVGNTAPEFTANTDAGTFDLASVTSPVFLEVFATWCPHCQHEVPIVDALAKKYAGKIAFVGVTGSPYGIDGSSPENQADVNAWVQKLNVTYPVAFDPNLTVANTYLQGGYPTLVLIGKDKKISMITSGEIPMATLEKSIDTLLSSGS
jgi:cytochrome c biogenesis protein CcmG/thiol:disulfide interchange protein DsbE